MERCSIGSPGKQVTSLREYGSPGHAKYVPAMSMSPRATTLRERSLAMSGDLSPRGQGPDQKSEKWRERGASRWPNDAADEQRRQPTQFTKAVEVEPLQRTVESTQQDIHAELWTRSLRTKGLAVDQIGMHNQNVATTTVAILFGRDGHGFSGRTNIGPRQNLKREMVYGPHTKDWIERPVAVGKHALDHMDGSRYQIDLSPRPCVPTSMAHATRRAQSGPRTAR